MFLLCKYVLIGIIDISITYVYFLVPQYSVCTFRLARTSQANFHHDQKFAARCGSLHPQTCTVAMYAVTPPVIILALSPNDVLQYPPHRQKFGIIGVPQVAKFMGPKWGPPGSCRPQMGPMLAPWTLLSGTLPALEEDNLTLCIVRSSVCNGGLFLFGWC